MVTVYICVVWIGRYNDSTSDPFLAYKLTKDTVTLLKVEPIYLHNALGYNIVDNNYCRTFFVLLKRWSLFVKIQEMRLEKEMSNAH